jgi:hypothetical protein
MSQAAPSVNHRTLQACDTGISIHRYLFGIEFTCWKNLLATAMVGTG